ncbi:MAG: hypothetical protein HZA51_02115 [Planctomycetes bacterium]|nr:hypothetical protein [Planctomycetota bacterium]
MTRPTRKQLTIIALGIAFVGWRASGMVQKYFPAATIAESPSVDKPDETVTAVGACADPTPEPISEAVVEAQRAIEARSWGRDPFDPAPFMEKPQAVTTNADTASEKPAPPAPTVKFNGVSRKGARWLAAVDGSIVGVGDVLQGKYRVAAITNNSLTLVSDGWMFHYDLGEKVAQVRPWTVNP